MKMFGRDGLFYPTKIGKGWDPITCTGTLYMTLADSSSDRQWREYRAEFRNGMLVSLHRRHRMTLHLVLHSLRATVSRLFSRREV